MSISYEYQDGIALVRFNRPEKLNALTLAMYRDLGDAFIAARDDDRVKVVILTGAGERAFCVGADLTESIPALAENKIDISAWDDAHMKHIDLHKPVISAINGLCFGGGFEIMLATDIRIASDDALFSLPEPSLGIVPAGGTLVRLTRQIAYAHAMELLLTAGRFSAARLMAMGVLNELTAPERLLERAYEVASQIARLSPHAVHIIKRSVRELGDLSLDAAFRKEAELGQIAFTGADAKKGLRAFMEGRKATFE
jgi:enoyl-CoA hydratase